MLAGVCSRREGQDYIKRGLVKVNGEVISNPGHSVPIAIKDEVELTLMEDAALQQSQLLTIMLNKPLGYVSSQPEEGKIPAIKLLVPENQYNIVAGHEHSNSRGRTKVSKGECASPGKLSGLAVCGRLDEYSTGLLIFSQDGEGWLLYYI